MRFIVFLALGLASSFGAFASPQPAYECEGANEATANLVPELGGVGTFIYAIDEDRFGLTGYPDNRDDYLVFDVGGHEGDRFKGKHVSFFKPSEASGLTPNVQINATGEVFECRSTKVVSNLQGAGDKGWIAGMALETIVRDKPSVNAARLDKLPFKEPIALLRNEGNDYQGYPWFQIEYSEGIKGYAWGGTLCSEGVDVAGVEGRCENIN